MHTYEALTDFYMFVGGQWSIHSTNNVVDAMNRLRTAAFPFDLLLGEDIILAKIIF